MADRHGGLSDPAEILRSAIRALCSFPTGRRTCAVTSAMQQLRKIGQRQKGLPQTRNLDHGCRTMIPLGVLSSRASSVQ